jgi:hypothetical protein
MHVNKFFINDVVYTICKSIMYISCIFIVVGFVCLVLAKIIYHIYLNLLLFVYVLSIKTWETSTNHKVNETYNVLCSISFFSNKNAEIIKYYDVNIISEKCNITAYCITEKILERIKNKFTINYVTLYLSDKCVYGTNIVEMQEIIICTTMMFISAGIVFYTLYWLISRNISIKK